GISSNQVTYTIEELPVNPAVAQSPMSGPPGTTFTQWGTGFTANSTAILHFKKPDGTEYPTQEQAMDSTGHFETSYTAPTDKEPGQYTWWAIDGPTGISSNQVTYTITDSPVPTIAQLPMTATPGMTLVQWGTGFTPNSTATLHFQKPDGTEFDPAVEPLDANGHFDIFYELPSDRTPGNYTWWAIDNTTGSESNHVSYTVVESVRTPQIDQSPHYGIVGDTFARWGSGFTPSGNVNIFEFVNGNWEMLKQIQAEADGSFTDEYTVPTNTEAGIHYWRAIDEATSTPSEQFEYTITSVRLHPQIEQDRNSVLPDDVPILHSGEGFTPSSGVTMHIRQPDLSEISLQLSTDEFGKFSKSRSIPADALIGSYQWWVTDDISQLHSNTLTYEVLTTSSNPVLEVTIESDLDLYRPGKRNVYNITVKNIGDSEINNAVLEVAYEGGLELVDYYCLDPFSDIFECYTIDGPNQDNDYFGLHIVAGGEERFRFFSTLSTERTSATIIATVSGGNPTVPNNSDSHTLEAFPSDLPGTQESKLFVRSLDGLSKARPTVVLTHGLQPLNSEDCEPEIGLWTGNLQRIPQASSLLKEFSLLEDPEMNVLQFFWKGACQEHGWGDVPTAGAYIKGRQNVYYAGKQLAVELENLLGKDYHQPIQFIGHSLGTAVNAYAARIFLKKATGIPKAQVTILDYPNNVSKIALMTDEDERLYGFDDNFFARVLPATSSIPLYVDNYYAEWTGNINTKYENFGVGSPINFPKPIVEQELKDSHEMDDNFFARVLPATSSIPLYVDNYYAEWTGNINTKYENFGVGSP
ncbi:MAG: hypothetical protein D3908_04640, partial [Candidatus Electrothrix sp. AUS4]|nr:hypothetical protein [Candidatus Electrothrix sp. AUS4]